MTHGLKRRKVFLILFPLGFFAAQCISCMRNGPALADSISGPMTQPAGQAGVVVRKTYSCYYYTDSIDMGDRIQARFERKGYALERREEAITKACNIYLPYGYDSKNKYPVIYIMHGITDNEDSWLDRVKTKNLLDNLIGSGTIEPCIAVFPNGNSSSAYLDRRFENQTGYYFFGNELVNDLIPFIESEYSVRSGRDSRALCGFSMGGMQTINVGLCQNLKYFGWFGAFSAAPTSYQSIQIIAYLKRENKDSLYPIHFFYNVCGETDDVARASHETALQDLMGATEFLNERNFIYQTVPGGHDYSIASIGLYNFLRICFHT